MGRERATEKKASKTPLEAKKKKKTVGDKIDSKGFRALPSAVTDKLAALVDLNHVAEHGFSKDIWVSLSLEEKNGLPAFISSQFRQSDGTKADKARNNDTKRIVHNQIMKYEKYAMRKFYSANRRKIKSIQKSESLSGQGAVGAVWARLDDSEKDAWYNMHHGAGVAGSEESESPAQK